MEGLATQTFQQTPDTVGDIEAIILASFLVTPARCTCTAHCYMKILNLPAAYAVPATLSELVYVRAGTGAAIVDLHPLFLGCVVK